MIFIKQEKMRQKEMIFIKPSAYAYECKRCSIKRVSEEEEKKEN